MPQPTQVTKTTFLTADTEAMTLLAGSFESKTFALAEVKAALVEATGIAKDFTTRMREGRQELNTKTK